MGHQELKQSLYYNKEKKKIEEYREPRIKWQEVLSNVFCSFPCFAWAGATMP